MLSAVYICGFLGLIVFGRLGSTILAGRRAALAAAAYLGAAVSLAMANAAPSTTACIGALGLAAFCLFGSFGPLWAIAVDLAPEASRGLVTGWVNFCGQVGGFVGPIAIGLLAGRIGSFAGGMLFMVGALLLAGVAMAVHAAKFPGSVSPQVAARHNR